MAAAEGLDAGEGVEQGPAEYGHGVGQVDDPSLGTAVPDGPGEALEERDGPHGPQDTAGAHRVPHGLIDAVLLRQMHVRRHVIQGAGQDGDGHEVRPRQCLLQGVRHGVTPLADGVGMGVDPVPDAPVPLRGGPVNIVEGDLPREALGQGEVVHEHPGPGFGPAADVTELDGGHAPPPLHG